MSAALFLALALFQQSGAAPGDAPDVATPVAPVTVTATQAPVADPRDRIVCRREHVLGSNRPQRICQTQRQWEAQRDQSREELREVRERPSDLPSFPRGGGR
ncbi:MAG: hypothetical protein ACT6RD_11480 [Brevundimonas sp.]|uniref:hypothetical protein n=1 Tax=Brevundimonas sp. TaxID=1871086 RepID=UPI004034AD28